MRGHVIGRMADTRHRFIANHGDDTTLQQLTSSVRDPIGKSGYVKRDPDKQGRNLFFFETDGKL
jgi:hypothetical protein